MRPIDKLVNLFYMWMAFGIVVIMTVTSTDIHIWINTTLLFLTLSVLGLIVIVVLNYLLQEKKK